MKTDAASVLGRLVFEERRKQGMNQSQLYQLSKVSSRTIVALENDKFHRREVRYDVIVRLALALGKDPHEWLKAVGKKVDEAKITKCRQMLGMTTPALTIQLSLSQIVASWMELPHEEQERVLRMMAAFLSMRLTAE